MYQFLALIMSVILGMGSVAEPTPESDPWDPSDPCRRGRGNDAVECLRDFVEQAVLAATGGIGGSGSTSARPVYLPYPRVTPGPDGQPCLSTGYHLRALHYQPMLPRG